MATERLQSWRRALVAAPAIGIGLLALSAFATGSRGGAAASPPPRAERPIARAAIVAQSADPGSHDSGFRRFSAPVDADLSEALHRAGVPDVAARDYVVQMLRVQGFARELSVADRFDLVVAYFPGEEPMLVYAGMDRVGRGDLQYLKYGDEHGRVEWIDARGLERRGSGAFALPVGGRVTSGFGTRMHPLLGFARFHRGIDLAAAWGTPIRAAADGQVVSAGWHGGYGRQVALAHGGGLDTSYGHMSRIVAHPGERVERGQVIGYVGSSGLSTGPHVHFEVSRNGRPVDPRSARIETPVAMSTAQREAFNGQLRSVLMATGS